MKVLCKVRFSYASDIITFRNIRDIYVCCLAQKKSCFAQSLPRFNLVDLKYFKICLNFKGDTTCKLNLRQALKKSKIILSPNGE